jgi:tetratricopeptide (TPR) repeat protein
MAAYYRDASTEDGRRAGGLNGHLSVARLLILEPPLIKGIANVLVYQGALYHRLHYMSEIVDRYTAAIVLPKSEMPIYALLDSITSGVSPLHRAREFYVAALTVDPGHSWARFNLAGIIAVEGGTGADELYQAAARDMPLLAPHASLRRAALREAAGDVAGAADLYVAAASGLDHLGVWHENAARCLRRCGRIADAMEHYNRSLEWVRQPGAEFLVVQPAPHHIAGSDYADYLVTAPPSDPGSR